MDKELQAEFDYVIIGTNFENSVLAGALSRIGKRILLIDHNSYYGCNNATLCFSELCEFANGPDLTKSPFDLTPLQAEEWIRLLNQPITRRTIQMENGEFDVKEEDPITPEQYEEDDIVLHSVLNEWNSSPITYWKHRFGSLQPQKSNQPPQQDKSEAEAETENAKEDLSNPNDDGEANVTKTTTESTGNSSMEDYLKSQNRRYNLDINSSMLLAGGEVVSVLAESGLGEYMQFYPMNSISALVYSNNNELTTNQEGQEAIQTSSLLKLPCSRQEVFASKAIGLKDKRLLSKFIQFIGDSIAKSEEDALSVNDVELKQGRSLSRPQNKSVMKIDLDRYKTTPFVDFLQAEFQISGILKDMIIYSICLGGSDRTVLADQHRFIPLLTPEGIQRVQEFISSLNIYGTTPFLYPIYGGGDVLQSFCRINNVYAGITMLQTQVLRVLSRKRDQQIVALEIVNERVHTIIRCKQVIASDEYAFAEEKESIQPVQTNLIHGIYVFRGNNRGSPSTSSASTTTSSMYEQSGKTEKDLRELVVIPATESHRAIYLIALNEEFKQTAKNESVIYAYMESEEMDEAAVTALYNVMEKEVNEYLGHLNSTIPISMLYQCNYVEVTKKCTAAAPNYHFISSRYEGCYLYMDHRMQRVRELFESLCPGELFLPQTHSSQEAEKDDNLSQELSLFDQLMDNLEKE